MLEFALSLFDDRAVRVRGKTALLALLLVAANGGAWAWAFAAFQGDPTLLATAFLAYAFGLRHAVDADHIAAIDNVTRKLMHQGRRPVSVGFFFSLGHSTVVLLASVAIALTAAAVETRFTAFREVGGLIGTGVSAAFLLAIAAVNLFILSGVCRAFRHARRGGAVAEEDLDALLAGRGLLARLFRRLFRLVGRSWHMYPLGFLFGLGFDTATEIGLLGISATQASSGVSVWAILVFPALFAAGMSLVDTADSALMTGAYGWAFVKPIRKLYYNLTITFVSAAVAGLVGGIEALGLIGDRLGLEGGLWRIVGSLNDDLGSLGCLIVGVFVVSWAASALIYRLKRYDETEVANG